jgi:hypothetical protein
MDVAISESVVVLSYPVLVIEVATGTAVAVEGDIKA